MLAAGDEAGRTKLTQIGSLEQKEFSVQTILHYMVLSTLSPISIMGLEKKNRNASLLYPRTSGWPPFLLGERLGPVPLSSVWQAVCLVSSSSPHPQCGRQRCLASGSALHPQGDG